MDTDLEQADLESMACWHHALASGEVEAIDGAFNLRLWFLGAKGDLRLYHEQARDYFEWSLPARGGRCPRASTWRRSCST